ncbi:MAG TPA: flotillin family protein [Vicinamibacteria bacterium]|nr:flotillin family protein [Vicinamibacteria bacterium]
MNWVVLLVVALAAVGILFLGGMMIVAKFYRKVEQGKALVVNKMKKDPEVTFTGAVVFPVIHKAETMDISVKTIEIDRRGKEGLICQDNIRADIKVTFFVRVNKTGEDVIKVAQAIGCARASSPETLNELFNAKFSEALKTVGKQLDFVDLYTKRDEFRDAIIRIIGRDLNGYVLEDAAIDYLEQTPLGSLDPQNILDAQGIRKITELTAVEHVKTNEFENNEKKSIKKQDVEAAEAILELERQQADAESRQKREIESVRARETAELQKIQAEERLKSESARIKTDEEVSIAEENKLRQVQVAQKNRERVIAVETERVEKDRQLEAISREREVELQRIDKEKALEVERKVIQDVIRDRVAVERTVVEEQERIKELQVVEEAKRMKQSTIITAEAQAQEQLVKDIKKAEAQEQAAKFKAQERITLAEADLEAADRQARAKIRLAEGVQAEEAAPGLAAARVKEADAVATEKHGLAEVKVKEADAGAIAKVGTAQASVVREKGLADAVAIKERLSAEARGIAEKAQAMKALDPSSREHEEYRLLMENQRTLGIEAIRASREVAEHKAKILGDALENADIDIVGGDGAFLDRIVNAVGMGKAVDEFIEQSDFASALTKDVVNGNKNIIQQIKQALLDSGIDRGTIKDITIGALLAKLAGGSSGDHLEKLQKLQRQAKALGLDDVRL